jgi:hypothetical protein
MPPQLTWSSKRHAVLFATSRLQASELARDVTLRDTVAAVARRLIGNCTGKPAQHLRSKLSQKA